MRSVSVMSLGPEFYEILYSPLGQDNEGVMLSVLSALARQDVDPWDEAARLASVPKEAVVKQLSVMLNAAPHRRSASPDAFHVTARLIALLPRHGRVNLAAYESLSVMASRTKPTIVSGFLFVAIYLVFISLTFAVIADVQTAARWEATARPTSNYTAAPQPLPSHVSH